MASASSLFLSAAEGREAGTSPRTATVIRSGAAGFAAQTVRMPLTTSAATVALSTFSGSATEKE